MNYTTIVCAMRDILSRSAPGVAVSVGSLVSAMSKLVQQLPSLRTAGWGVGEDKDGFVYD